MRFLRFAHKGRRSIGVEVTANGDIVDICAGDSSIPSNLRQFLEGGNANLAKAKSVVESGQHVIPKAEVQVLAPLDDPQKIICLGMNYADHCAELNLPVPDEPAVFSKFNSSIVGPYDNVPHPTVTEQLDWEGELAVILGKAGKNIPVEKAMEHVFGYTIALDVTARDWIHKNGGQVLLASSMDGFSPFGPVVVTKEEMTDPHNLSLKTLVNGEIKQDSNTKHLIFKTEYLIHYLSRFFTLMPGDVIITGTPNGTGMSQNPPTFLKRGDVVTVEIEGIGSIANKIV